MAVTGSITTRFIDEKGVDLGKTLIEKDYLISVYPNIVNQFDTPMLMGWGNNVYGVIGDNTTVDKSSPVQTITYSANWKQISGINASYDGRFAAIKTDGTLWMWGRNSSGQLGDNTTLKKSSPVQTVAGGTNWKSVACGYSAVAAIKSDGTLWIWGNNSSGQLGNNTTSSRSSPVQTVTFGTNWKSSASGASHVAAIKDDGTLWIWGNNSSGQLGNNTITDRSSPIQTVTFGTNWKQVACGDQMTAAVKNDGTLWTWGRNTYGGLGDNTTAPKSSPVQTVAFGTNWKQVSCGYYSMAAIKTDGTLWCWGYNWDNGGVMLSGQLGDNTNVTARSSPVQTIAYGTNWKLVCCSAFNTSAIKTDGTLWNWGSGFYGNLGDNATANRSSPVQTVIGGQNWKSVALSRWTTLAIKDGDF